MLDRAAVAGMPIQLERAGPSDRRSDRGASSWASGKSKVCRDLALMSARSIYSRCFAPTLSSVIHLPRHKGSSEVDGFQRDPVACHGASARLSLGALPAPSSGDGPPSARRRRVPPGARRRGAHRPYRHWLGRRSQQTAVDQRADQLAAGGIRADPASRRRTGR